MYLLSQTLDTNLRFILAFYFTLFVNRYTFSHAHSCLCVCRCGIHCINPAFAATRNKPLLGIHVAYVRNFSVLRDDDSFFRLSFLLL